MNNKIIYLFTLSFMLLFSVGFSQGNEGKKKKKEEERETINEIGDSLLDIVDAEFEIKVQYYDDGSKISEGKYLKIGAWKYYYKGGQVKLEGNYVDNKKDGLWTRYDEYGNVIISGYFNKGIKTGKWTIYYPDSEMKHYEVNFKKGKLDGKVQAWYKEGTLMKEEFYEMGVKEGKWLAWYNTGQQKFEGMYVEGKKHGVWKTWHWNGQLESEGGYDLDKKDGVWTEWDEHGEITRRNKFKKGRLLRN